MSGGHFEYSQYQISQIAKSIRSIIEKNGVVNEEYGFSWSYDYSPETLKEFENAIEILNKAYVYAQRIDWLVSGDDGEETFHKRLKEELEKLCPKSKT